MGFGGWKSVCCQGMMGVQFFVHEIILEYMYISFLTKHQSLINHKQSSIYYCTLQLRSHQMHFQRTSPQCTMATPCHWPTTPGAAPRQPTEMASLKALPWPQPARHRCPWSERRMLVRQRKKRQRPKAGFGWWLGGLGGSGRIFWRGFWSACVDGALIVYVYNGFKVAVSIGGCGDFMPCHQALELAFRYAANTAMGRALANAEETARKQALATATEKAPGCSKCCRIFVAGFFFVGAMLLLFWCWQWVVRTPFVCDWRICALNICRGKIVLRLPDNRRNSQQKSKFRLKPWCCIFWDTVPYIGFHLAWPSGQCVTCTP